MEETDHEMCILCNKQMEEKDKIRIGEKAINTIIKASKEIGDRKHLKMKDVAFLNVHKNCQILYSRPSHIKSEKKAISDKLTQLKRDNKEARKLDFSSLCIFCGSDAITDTHKKPIQLVSSDDTKANILKALESRSDDDDFNKKLKLRLHFADDLQIKKARYHAKCMQAFYKPNPTKIVGRPMDENVSAVVHHVINHILENSDDSQFSLKEMIEGFRDNLPRISLIKNHLSNYFEDDIIIHTVPNDTIICFMNRQGKILDNEWYKKAPKDEEERLRIVEMVANIIRQDIRIRHYNTHCYNAPSSFLDDVEKDVPKSLQVFLNTVIKSNKHCSEHTLENKWSKEFLQLRTF